MDVTLSPLDTSVESIGSLLGLIGIIFIPIEFVWLMVRRKVTVQGLREMGASYGTAVLFILTQGISLAVAYVGLSAVEFFVPLVLLGFPVLAVLLGWGVVIAYQGWIHTEMVPNLGVLERFFNTPSNHRVHHGSDVIYLDKNYGGITVLFDRIFGTYQREEQRPVYGLTKQIGTANPVKVQMYEIRALRADVRAADFRTTKWNHLVRGPGWQPDQAADSYHSGELL